MDYFVTKEGLHRRRRPCNATYILQGGKTRGLKPVKRFLCSDSRRLPRSNKVFQLVDHELPGHDFHSSRIPRVNPDLQNRQHRKRNVRLIQEMNDPYPSDLRYCPNININTSACGPGLCGKARHFAHGEGARAHASDHCTHFSNERFGPGYSSQQPRSSDFLHQRCDHTCTQFNCQLHPLSGGYSMRRSFGTAEAIEQNTFDRAQNILHATVLKAERLLDGIYSSFLEEVIYRRHSGRMTRDDIWKQLVAQSEDLGHTRHGRYHDRSSVSLRDIQKELHGQFAEFEHCLIHNSVEGNNRHPYGRNGFILEEESKLEQLQDARQTHRKVVRDIDGIRPYLDIMRHDHNAARMVLCDLDIVLSRLGGYRRLWVGGVRSDRERRYGYLPH